MRNRLEMVPAWSDFSIMIIGSLRWKRFRKSKMSKIVQKSSCKPILTWEIDWKCFRNYRTSLSWSSVPLIKRILKSKMLWISRKSSYEAIWTWDIDWKWFRNGRTSFSWSSVSSYKTILAWEIDWKWFQHDPTSLSWLSIP